MIMSRIFINSTNKNIFRRKFTFRLLVEMGMGIV